MAKVIYNGNGNTTGSVPVDANTYKAGPTGYTEFSFNVTGSSASTQIKFLDDVGSSSWTTSA